MNKLFRIFIIIPLLCIGTLSLTACLQAKQTSSTPASNSTTSPGGSMPASNPTTSPGGSMPATPGQS